MKMLRFALVMLAACFLNMAAPVRAHAEESGPTKHAVTLGAVQSKVKVGASGEDVILAIGSPNIVTTDGDGNETWVYDRLSVEQESSTSSVSGALVMREEGDAVAHKAKKVDSSSSTSQKNLLVVVKFDEHKRVAKVQYREATY